jgi:tetratricopeptide (TPR) repeat protein
MRQFIAYRATLAVLLFATSPVFFSSTCRADAPPGNVFYAASPEQFPEEFEPSLLPRELARQAVLMAARDGLGCYTRDQVMGEWDPAADPPGRAAGPPLRLNIHSDYPRSINLDAIDPSHGNALIGRIVFHTQYTQLQWLDITSFVQTAEQAARGDALQLLRKAAYSGVAVPSSDAGLPVSIDDLLYRTTLMAPLSALMQTHAMIRESGESQARLGALVRGYANLGQLTRFQWSTTNKVMTARSLLYAQKMVIAAPDSRLARWHRAYAFAMAGFHQAALNDLTDAAKLSDPTNPAIPPWVELIEPLCRYDISKLQALVTSDPRRAPLAALCCFLDVENCGSYSRLTTIGQAMLQQNPACFRIIDGLTANAGIAAGHGLTEMPFPVMLRTLRDDIHLLPAVPATVADAFTAAGLSSDHIANLANVSAAFITAAETSEPSYCLAGRIIQETNFVHVQRRAEFMADQWSVDAGDFIQQMQPLISGHRFEPYIQSLAHPAQTRGQLLAAMEISDPQFQMIPMIQLQRPLGKIKNRMTGETAFLRAYYNNDGSAYDLERTFYPFYAMDSNAYELDQAVHCRLYSPYSGIPVSQLLIQDWKANKPSADKWAQQFADQPAVLLAIGRGYAADKQYDKAESVLRQCAKIAPDRLVLEPLAQLYLDTGREDQWESALLEVKAQPDLGLDHAAVDQEIARHYLSVGKYEKGRPFADAASDESGAGWAMETAALADEYCGDFVAAEAQMQAEAQRYGDPDWFLWCKRTGKGHLALATTAVDTWVNTQITEKNLSNYQQVGLVLYLENQPGRARDFLEQSMNTRHEAWAGMLAASICLQQLDGQARRDDLQFVVDHCKTNSDGDDYSGLVQLAAMELASGDKAPSKEQLDKGLVGQDNNTATNLFYFAGRARELTGEATKAKHDYQRMIQWGNPSLWSFTLACDQLHQLGVLDTPLPRVGGK